jgi:hypothetical protein
MLLCEHRFSTADPGGSRSEAIVGFTAIAAELDRGIEATKTHGSKFSDAVAIGLGWLVLAAVIFYPALQLAAIVACVTFMGMRSFVRHVIAAPASEQVWPSHYSSEQERSFLMA